MRRSPWWALGALLAAALVATVASGCAEKRAAPLGAGRPGVGDCPSSPNCVSSRATDEARRVEPLRLAMAPAEAWERIGETVRELPRTTVVTFTDGYLHAECRSRIFGFVDDLELALRADEGIVDVRSASRSGYWDLGVNRRRVAAIVERLRERGVVD